MLALLPSSSSVSTRNRWAWCERLSRQRPCFRTQSVPFGDALIGARAQQLPDVVIVGLQPCRRGIAGPRRGATSVPARASVMVALAEAPDSNAILGAMRAGYKEFVVLPDDAARLRQVVHEAAFRPTDDEEKGRVSSRSPGPRAESAPPPSPCTSPPSWPPSTECILMDFDFGMGDVAPMMDISGRDSVADLLPRADRLDERMLTSAVHGSPHQGERAHDARRHGVHRAGTGGRHLQPGERGCEGLPVGDHRLRHVLRRSRCHGTERR